VIHTELRSHFSNLIKSVVYSRVKTTAEKYVGFYLPFFNLTNTYTEITFNLPCTELHLVFIYNI